MHDTIQDRIVLSTFSIAGLYMQLISYFFLINDEYQCKDIPEVLRINRSSCVHKAKRSHIVHRSFTAHFALRLRSAFAHRSPFISVHRISFSVCSQYVKSALTVRSECVHVRSKCAHRSLTVQEGKNVSGTVDPQHLILIKSIKTTIPVLHNLHLKKKKSNSLFNYQYKNYLLNLIFLI